MASLREGHMRGMPGKGCVGTMRDVRSRAERVGWGLTEDPSTSPFQTLINESNL